MEQLSKFNFEIRKTTEPAVCEKHGDFELVKTFYGLTNKFIKSGCPTCSAEREAEELARKQRDEQEAKERRYAAFLNDTGIPLRFQSRDFAGFVADTPEKQKALEVSQSYVANFEDNRRDGKGMVFSGKPGTGKSHLCAAIIKAIHPKFFGRYITVMDLMRAIRSTWKRDSEKTETDVLDYFVGLELLVIDEIGVQYGTESEQHILFDVLDLRYREMKPTILITNQDSAGFKTFVGERVFDRLRETSTWVPFNWESFRPKARQ